MASYLFAYTNSMAGDGRPLVEQAGELLDVKLWGINVGAQNRGRLAAGDDIVVYVGGPERERAFVGHAVLASGGALLGSACPIKHVGPP